MEGDGLMLCLEIVIGEGRESKRSNLAKSKSEKFLSSDSGLGVSDNTTCYGDPRLPHT